MRIEDRSELEVRPAEAADLRAVAGVAARAFEDDPAIKWFFPDGSILPRLEKAYRALLPRQHRVDFVEISTTDDLSGVAIWAGPERWDPPTRSVLGAMPALFRQCGGRGLGRFVKAMAALKEAHPKQPHWYLSLLCTDPPRQRTGVGTALLAPALARCDAHRLGAYLETQKADNVPYYSRFGFRVTGEMDLPGGGPHMWLMWRDPQ